MYICFAPMDGITTCATRLITKKVFDTYNQGCILGLRSEFMNADGFLINPNQVIKHILTSEGQKPIAQIYGGNCDTLIKAAEKIQNEYSEIFSGIELNTGCPSNTVMKVGGGSDMLKDKKKTLSIIQSLYNIGGPLPLSLKTRAGLNEGDKLSQLDFLTKASNFCNKITIHGRTLLQLYKGESDWNFIKEVKDRIKLYGNIDCQVIGNGGISSFDEAKSKILEFGLDGIMIGQSAIGNPWIFTNHTPSNKEKLNLTLMHLDYSIACDQRFDEKIATKPTNEINTIDINIPNDWIEIRCKKNLEGNDFYPHTIIEFRKFLFQYVKGIQGSKERKQSILQYSGYHELRNQIISFFNTNNL